MATIEGPDDTPPQIVYMDADPDADRCDVCGTTGDVTRWNGSDFCRQHLQERMARETRQ